MVITHSYMIKTVDHITKTKRVKSLLRLKPLLGISAGVYLSSTMQRFNIVNM